jgi:diguanylate cyclase (GGDEF)-like protein
MVSKGADVTYEKTDRQLRLYVGLVVFAGFGTLGWAASRAHFADPAELLYPALMALIIMAANGPVVRIRLRSQHHYFSSTSSAILIAIASMPGPWVVLCTAVGVLCAKLVTQRDVMKISFNVAKDTHGAALAVLAAGLFHIGPVSLDSAADPSWISLALGLTAAIVCYTAVDDGLGYQVLAMATRTTWTQVALRNWDIHLVARVIHLVIALLAAQAIARDPRLLIALPPILLVLHLIARNMMRSRAEREDWRRLAQTIDELNVKDLADVLRSVATQAPKLFSADEAEVELPGEDGDARLVRGSSGHFYDGTRAAAPDPDAASVIEARLEGHDGGHDLGVLRLRFGKAVKFRESEHYKLKALASALYTAIRNANAYAELQRVADEHAYAAAHDSLTGLPNRRQLLERAEEAFDNRTDQGMVALLLIDLNHFKEVNDTLGHQAGDKVLREVATMLERGAHPGDLVARLGGDEFAVLLTGLPTPALATHRAEALLSCLDRSIEIDGMRLTVEACGGIASAPGSGGVTELLRRADVAMYQAKRSGQRTATYEHARDTADIGRLMLGGELRRAVAEHEFIVDFQPIVDLGSGEVISAEALARWHHPEHGNLSPMQFLETVERSGQLPAFADAVLEQSLTAYGMWREAGFDLPVAVNVSPRSLLDETFPSAVLSRLARHGVPADRLVLELAETLTLSQLEVVDRALSELRDAGVRLALDDFGTGVSSLTVLSRIPVHQLKIDREFVTAVETSSEAAAVIRSTVDLARSLHLTVVAEGVESEPQRHALWELGCVAGQGHLFARPMRSDRLLATLLRGSGGRPGALSDVLHTAGSVVRMPHRRSPGHGRSSLPHLPA